MKAHAPQSNVASVAARGAILPRRPIDNFWRHPGLVGPRPNQHHQTRLEKQLVPCDSRSPLTRMSCNYLSIWQAKTPPDSKPTQSGGRLELQIGNRNRSTHHATMSSASKTVAPLHSLWCLPLRSNLASITIQRHTTRAPYLPSTHATERKSCRA
jgi:hypothetical protein